MSSSLDVSTRADIAPGNSKSNVHYNPSLETMKVVSDALQNRRSLRKGKVIPVNFRPDINSCSSANISREYDLEYEIEKALKNLETCSSDPEISSDDLEFVPIVTPIRNHQEGVSVTPEILKEANEIITDADSDSEINKNSAQFAHDFLEKFISLTKKETFTPALTLHPDGDIGISLQNECGMFSLSFSGEGVGFWALYFPGEQEEANGRFQYSGDIPSNVVLMIDKFC